MPFLHSFRDCIQVGTWWIARHSITGNPFPIRPVLLVIAHFYIGFLPSQLCDLIGFIFRLFWSLFHEDKIAHSRSIPSIGHQRGSPSRWTTVSIPFKNPKQCRGNRISEMRAASDNTIFRSATIPLNCVLPFLAPPTSKTIFSPLCRIKKWLLRISYISNLSSIRSFSKKHNAGVSMKLKRTIVMLGKSSTKLAAVSDESKFDYLNHNT